MHKVLSVGSASVDIKAFSYQEDIRNAYREGTIDLVPGGVARGMAINLKQLGFESAICSVVGNDIFGEYIRTALDAAKVNTQLLKTSQSGTTALFSVMGAQGGPASCVYSNSVLQEIRLDQSVRSFIAQNGIDTIVLDSNLSMETLGDFYRLKQESILNGAQPLFIFQNATSPDIAKKSLQWAPLIDLFAANEFEAAAILETRPGPDHITADRFREIGFNNFIITFGAEGVLVSLNGKTWIEKAYKPAAVVDTIGAGDAFASGFLFGLLNGKAEKTCIRYGLACARETIATRDTVCGFLTAEFLENYPYAQN